MLNSLLLHDPWPVERWTTGPDGKMQPREEGAVPPPEPVSGERTFAELQCLWKREFGTDLMHEHEMESAGRFRPW
jgi:hypothetical protein